LFNKTSANILQLKIRKEAFLEIINEHLPWEDMLIGFQTRVNRIPNVYNSNFWYHFTNIYIKKKAERYLKDCSACESFVQSIDALN